MRFVEVLGLRGGGKGAGKALKKIRTVGGGLARLGLSDNHDILV